VLRREPLDADRGSRIKRAAARPSGVGLGSHLVHVVAW